MDGFIKIFWWFCQKMYGGLWSWEEIKNVSLWILAITFIFLLTEGSVGSDRGSIADSEEENEEEVRACWCVQVILGRKLRVHLAGSVNNIFMN